MNTDSFLLSFFFLTGATITMLLIFGLIIWRGSVALNIAIKPKIIFLSSLTMLIVMIMSVITSSLNFKGLEILGTVLLRIIYLTWIISPLLIIRDLISIYYKIPPVFMIMACGIWIAFGIYKGTTTKFTSLDISSDQVTKPYTIVFISDIHVDTIRNQKYIQSIVNKIKKIKPDFVLLAGDLMNTAKLTYVDAFLPFNQVQIPVYGTLGNHDHMGDSGAIARIFENTKIKALRNQSTEVDNIQVVGIDDKSYRDKKTLEDILKESNIKNNGQFTILISHQPQKLNKLEGYPIDLELAGHTHNGQFIPFSWVIGLFNDYKYGKYTYNNKITFVSQGIGSRGAPLRIGTQSELVIISLKPKTK